MDSTKILKIGMTGSRKWENKLKLKNLIFKLKGLYGSELTVVSGGTNEGVDALVKKYCIEFDMDYAEMRPNHFEWTHYCLEPPFMYGKPFKPNNYYIRNTKLVADVGAMLLFITKDDTSPVMKDIIKQCEKKGKKVIIISE